MTIMRGQNSVMEFLKSYIFPHYSEDDILLAAQKRLLHIICLMAGVLLVSFIWFDPQIMNLDSNVLYKLPYFIMPAIPFVLAWLVSRNKFIKPISILILTTIYLILLQSRFDLGFFLPGAVFFLAIPTLGAILIGIRTGAFLTLLITATYIGMYALQRETTLLAGTMTPERYAFQATLDYTVIGGIISVATLLFVRAMNQVIARLKQMNDQLNMYKDNLEKLVDQRTETIRQQADELTNALEAQKQANALQNSLVTVVSHEIRTPLAIIDGVARRMERRPEKLSTEDITNRTDTIRKNVSRLIQLVERTLESARYAEGAISMQVADFDLKALLQDVCAREQGQSSFHYIESDLSALPELYHGDMNLLDHVFSNIISNAMKYAPDTPKIELRTERSDTDICIRVKDYGIGIPANELPRISNRFFRASTSHGFNGTGVGLFLTRRITEDHGGRLEIDSMEGEWTEVTIRLPLPASDSDRDTQGPGKARAA